MTPATPPPTPGPRAILVSPGEMLATNAVQFCRNIKDGIGVIEQTIVDAREYGKVRVTCQRDTRGLFTVLLEFVGK